jgi:hypothetical protein
VEAHRGRGMDPLDVARQRRGRAVRRLRLPALGPQPRHLDRLGWWPRARSPVLDHQRLPAQTPRRERKRILGTAPPTVVMTATDPAASCTR